ncbi:DNA topoisomerase [Gregarina niphandrodes]|uniref:DNA topoisomerase n=1 Tax=Gregarina niphandrodes TaxID=110365 RepID=A0A023BA44_GRENI|nr:DNA topoisomerase [Gregarina niphandrodes]EZG77690.1 DNA topoisomerase [Gregarina niphandrodes]|eukprot:XP_011129489.1 DNA topoisomerase [Gregarina niphandrodes]
MPAAVVLNVAEKPSVAKSIAALYPPANKRYINSASQFNPVVAFDDVEFEGHAGATMIFTSVRGHLTEVDYEEEYQEWRRCPPSALFSAPIERKVPKDSKSLERNLRTLSKDCSHLVLWLDCDREGEAIAHEVMEVCLKSNRRLHCLRAHFSAVTAQAVQRALNSLTAPDQKQAQAVEVRRELDLRIGTSITRLLTLKFVKKFDMPTKVVSYGPCQLPTLGFVVTRWLAIQRFQPEDYYYLTLTVNKAQQPVVFSCQGDRIYDKTLALMIYQKCLVSSCVVSSVQKKETTHRKPKPMSET